MLRPYWAALLSAPILPHSYDWTPAESWKEAGKEEEAMTFLGCGVKGHPTETGGDSGWAEGKVVESKHVRQAVNEARGANRGVR